MLTVRHAALTDPGRRHDENQDRLLADAARGLFLISDGMAEAVSSQRVIEVLPGLVALGLTGIDNLADPRAAEAVRAAVAEVSDLVRVARDDDLEVTGATVVLALVRGGTALVAHLGDSRAYLMRGGGLSQLTRDHSQLQRMVDEGWITEAEAAGRGNGGPTRFAGMFGDAEADVRCLELCAGDRILLCSDGLTEELEDRAIAPHLMPGVPPATCCRRLVDAANRAGGHDNVTVIVIAAD